MARPLIWLALLCASLTFATCVVGIHLELTHVDAKANCTVEERMRRAAERTHRRLASMGGAGATAPVHWATTQYIAEYFIGDLPPQKAEAIIDSGSNLVWTQCASCSTSGGGCFSQDLPYYDPSKSGPARPVSRNDAACALGSETSCPIDNGGDACAVCTSYGAGNIAGVVSTDVFTFGSEKVRLAFGCITATEITPGSLDGASGVIGLGRGALSLVSQLRETKFSYCLTPYYTNAPINPSHLFVGASAGLSPNNAPVTYVPFVNNPTDYPFNTFYYLPLAGITVGQTMLDVPAEAFELRLVQPGQWVGTLIDSGSPYTSLADVAYQALKDELTRQLGSSLVQPPSGQHRHDLCVARMNAGMVPPLVLHFGSGGGDLVVPPENYWGPVDDTTACMLVSSSSDSMMTIIGNYMQQNMHLLYDLGNGVLSFQTADCSSMG